MYSNRDFLHLENWDAILHSLAQLTPLVILESQDDSGASYVAAFPKKLHVIQELTQTNLSDFESLFSTSVWLFGYISYDAKNAFERLESTNPNPIGLPHVWLMEPQLILKKTPEHPFVQVIQGDVSMIPDVPSSKRTIKIGTPICDETPESYSQKIKKIQAFIREGRVYEVNLSRLIRYPFQGEPFELYKAMRDCGPVPMAAFIQTRDWAICSASPEVFLIKQGHLIESRPIKGTRKRQSNYQDDARQIHELQSSEKEKAENLMIVDLVRNDFNRVAKPGSVKVEKLFAIHSYATVHQMESVIKAEILPHKTLFDVLKAAFPMGSMTGAPKIEAMRVIDELETYQRNIYSGTIGCISPQHDAQFNVVIRTAVIKNNELFYGVGGAITSDSDPIQEWQETEVKTQALVQAIHRLQRKSVL